MLLRDDLRFGLPAVHAHEPVFRIDPQGDLAGKLLQHVTEERQIVGGHRAQDHALHAAVDVGGDAVIVADASAHLHKEAGGFHDFADDVKILQAAVLGAVQIHHVQILGAALQEFLCGLERGDFIPLLLSVIPAGQADHFSAAYIDCR